MPAVAHNCRYILCCCNELLVAGGKASGMGWSVMRVVTPTLLVFISLRTPVSHASFSQRSPSVFDAPGADKTYHQLAPFSEEDIHAIQVCNLDLSQVV